jgi:hypothetical protein
MLLREPSELVDLPDIQSSARRPRLRMGFNVSCSFLQVPSAPSAGES